MSSLPSLLERLQYQPKDDALIRQALTHRSFGKDHNERLEFIGDALLDLVVGDALFQRFPEKPEGELSRFRAELVKGETLAELALDLDLGSYVRLGQGERKSGGGKRQSILANTFEAIIGAIYMEAGFDAARQTSLQLFERLIDSIEQRASHKDPKTTLQEHLQAQKRKLPIYQLESTSGQQHSQTFLVSCRLVDQDVSVEASGRSKKLAEQQAAALMLEQLTSRETL
ncbi:Ribonuclease 3 [BD1-7 clade bacterium]|uniref:Ribonuclease 3 n=1 Tax=BD1-7 clade bacterium TaxID=2029982 RepID=A0A5S9QCF7_9GAMM|nr:Ribonuclease 3 [BD1-7 clade bacterium]CAA0115951.1 Ribonuclease 3 [BD1-7 clade bacterium]